MLSQHLLTNTNLFLVHTHQLGPRRNDHPTQAYMAGGAAFADVDVGAVQTKIMPATAEGAHLPTAGGATHRLVEDAQDGLASNVLTAAPASGQLTNVALFIDQNSQQLGTVAEVKWW